MQKNADRVLGYIFQSEGGFAVRETEPGGSVNMGVSQQTLATWRQAHGEPVPTVADVQALTKAEATAIYESLYLLPIRFAALPSGLDYCVFDSAVNEGNNGALRFLAKAIGFDYKPPTPPVDELVQVTFGARLNRTIDAFCDLRLAAKKLRPEWPHFGAGWTARIELVRRRSKELASPTAS